MMEEIKGQNDGIILFSHSLTPEIHSVKDLTEFLLESEKIKKIYILELDWMNVSHPVSEIIESIKKIRMKKSEFIKTVDSNKFNKRVLYEISKDTYF